MSIREGLYKLYWAMQRRVVPGLRYSQELYEDELLERVSEDVRWLDLGCGHQVLPPWRSNEEKHIVQRAGTAVGLDYDMGSLSKHETIRLRVRGDITNLPFAEGSFDLVTANMVVEHLDEPIPQFQEFNRVLANGGSFVCLTPNTLSYPIILARLIPEWLKKWFVLVFEGRAEEDLFKTHYRANSEKRLRGIAAMTGFEVHRIRMILTSAVFVVLPPLLLFELLWIRVLRSAKLRSLRPNILAWFKKPGGLEV